jgi:hypothetical protein
MGFMKNTFTKLQSKAEEALDKANNSDDTSIASDPAPDSTASNWEKAVADLDVIVTEVSKIAPDGVDIVCVGGEEETEWHRNIKNAKGLEALVTKEEPSGKRNMGAAMDEVLQDVLTGDLKKKRHVSVLVLSAGRPDDTTRLEKSLLGAAQKVAKSGVKESPLSVTFIQIGDDQRAGAYFEHLSRKTTINDIIIVDTMLDVEIKSTMEEMQISSKSSKQGLIVGSLAGAAIGAGGMYAYNKRQTKKHSSSNHFNGKFKCFYEEEEIMTLKVVDDREGSLTIEGFHEEVVVSGNYGGGKFKFNEVEEETEFFIRFTDPSGGLVEGIFLEEERTITWSDGTRWEAVVPPKLDDAKYYAGAAAVGAIAVGTTGYMLDKKFFSKVSKKDQCDYIIIVDRSANMSITKEEIDIEVDVRIDVDEEFDGTSTKEEIDVKIDVKEDKKVRRTKKY